MVIGISFQLCCNDDIMTLSSSGGGDNQQQITKWQGGETQEQQTKDLQARYPGPDCMINIIDI